MKELFLFVLFTVPTKDCIERVTKENLTNCRKHPLSQGLQFERDGMVFLEGGYNLKRADREITECDEKPKAEQKEIPKAKVEIFAEAPLGAFDRNDGCSDFLWRKVKVEEAFPTVSFTTVTIGSYIHWPDVSISTSIIIKPKKKR